MVQVVVAGTFQHRARISAQRVASRGLQVMMASWNNGSPTPAFNNAAQSWNHEFYWSSMSPEKKGSSCFATVSLQPVQLVYDGVNHSKHPTKSFASRLSVAFVHVSTSGAGPRLYQSCSTYIWVAPSQPNVAPCVGMLLCHLLEAPMNDSAAALLFLYDYRLLLNCVYNVITSIVSGSLLSI